MPRRDPGPSIKDKALYERLRDKGDSKEKAARISNAVAGEGQRKVSRRGGKSPSYEEWHVPELRKRARELGIEGRSTMSKSELVDALRHH